MRRSIEFLGLRRCSALVQHPVDRTFFQLQTRAFFAATPAFFMQPTPVLLRRPMKGRKKFREPKPGDWTCQCGTINFRAKRECFQCNAPAPPLPPGQTRPKMPGEDPNDWACPCGKMNYRGNVNCHKCHMPKPVAPPAPGENTENWKCQKCKNINRPNRKFCFRCNCAKDAVITDGGKASAGAAAGAAVAAAASPGAPAETGTEAAAAMPTQDLDDEEEEEEDLAASGPFGAASP